jgi:hypothetical protein
MRVLMLGAVLSAASNLLFAWLSTRGHDVAGLTLVVSADNLAGGIASAAFIAYLSGLTNVKYSATQYALFSSMMLLLPKFLAAFQARWWTPWATRPSLQAPPCWACRCWCWCGWRRGMRLRKRAVHQPPQLMRLKAPVVTHLYTSFTPHLPSSSPALVAACHTSP